MPADAAKEGEALPDAWEDVEDSAFGHTATMPFFPRSSGKDHWSEGLPNTSRKRTKVSLPIRLNQDARYQTIINKHHKGHRSKRGPTALAGAKSPSSHHQSKEDEADGADDLSHSASTGRRQHLAGGANQDERSGSFSAAQSGRRSAQLRDQRPAYNDRVIGPVTLLGAGDNDPFSALPSDLPRAFITQRLYGSKWIVPLIRLAPWKSRSRVRLTMKSSRNHL